jgi:hypothetical protein
LKYKFDLNEKFFPQNMIYDWNYEFNWWPIGHLIGRISDFSCLTHKALADIWSMK